MVVKRLGFGNYNGRVTRFEDGVLVEPDGLKCYAVNCGERFCGFVFAHSRSDALVKVSGFGKGYVLVGFGFSAVVGGGSCEFG